MPKTLSQKVGSEPKALRVRLQTNRRCERDLLRIRRSSGMSELWFFAKKSEQAIYSLLRRGRSDWIRTSGHLNPIQVLYQTEPHPVKQQNLLYYILKKKASLFCKKFQKYLIYIEIIISNRIFMYKSSVLFSITC